MFRIRSIGSSTLTTSFAAPAILAALLTTVLVVFSGVAPANAVPVACDPGSATWDTDEILESTVYIRTAADLILLSTDNTYWGFGLTYVQTADIDLGGCEWSPIGTALIPFTGTYNGDGFAVNGLKISSTTAGDVGFFGFVASGSYIQELTVIGEIDIPLGSTAGGSTVGGIAGYISGDTYLSQVIADVDISILASTGAVVGGLVGMADYGTIQYSSHRGQFDVSGNQFVGGLVGFATDQINILSSYTIATFDVTGLSGYRSAGIIADSDCQLNHTVTKTYSVGAGQHWGVQIEDCGTFQDSFYNNTTFIGNPTSDAASVAGVLGQTTLDLKDPITYEQNNWNIVEGWVVFERFGGTQRIWGICSLVNDGYPYLLWEYSSNPCVSGGSDNSALASTGSNLGDYSGPVAGVLLAGTGLVLLGRLRRRSKIHV